MKNSEVYKGAHERYLENRIYFDKETAEEDRIIRDARDKAAPPPHTANAIAYHSSIVSKTALDLLRQRAGY